MSGHRADRVLDDTSPPDGFRGAPADRALVTYLTMKLSIAQEQVAELTASLHSAAEYEATRSALAVATWRATTTGGRGTRLVRRLARAVATRRSPAFVMISRAELRDALETLDLFDAAAYTAAVPEAAGGAGPLAHYLDHGFAAGADPGPGFSTSRYLAANGDVAASGANALGHYLVHGWRECRPGVGRIALRPR